MPKQQTTTATVQDDGTLLGSGAGETLVEWLSDTFALFAGGRVEISVSRPTRTLRQNRTLWGVVYPQVHKGLKEAGVHDLHLMDDDGHLMDIPVTVHFIHRLMKRRHLTPDEPGQEPTTRTLSTTEFTEYIRAIRHDPMLTKHDIYIEMPEDEPPVEAYE
jgi:hypothetical protein